MIDCECLPNCPFFHDKMANMPTMASMYKRNYCQGDNSSCARYEVFTRMGSGSVPSDLFPNDSQRATEFLAENGFSA